MQEICFRKAELVRKSNALERKYDAQFDVILELIRQPLILKWRIGSHS